jgi:hypothetical protein
LVLRVFSLQEWSGRHLKPITYLTLILRLKTSTLVHIQGVHRNIITFYCDQVCSFFTSKNEAAGAWSRSLTLHSYWGWKRVELWPHYPPTHSRCA